MPLSVALPLWRLPDSQAPRRNSESLWFFAASFYDFHPFWSHWLITSPSVYTQYHEEKCFAISINGFSSVSFACANCWLLHIIICSSDPLKLKQNIENRSILWMCWKIHFLLLTANPFQFLMWTNLLCEFFEMLHCGCQQTFQITSYSLSLALSLFFVVVEINRKLVYIDFVCFTKHINQSNTQPSQFNWSSGKSLLCEIIFVFIFNGCCLVCVKRKSTARHGTII